MATMEDIMLSIGAQDNASRVFESIGSAAHSSLNSINTGMMNISSSMDSMLSSVTGKSAAESIFGTSSKNETNKVLLTNMTETQKAADDLFKHVDEVTNTSLTSMQDLIPAMNAFKAATGATDDEISYASDGMANFGAAVLAQTGSTDLAAGAMMDLSKGIKGLFASLDQYGVSEDALMRTGLWSGKEDDIKGYMDAVTEVIGSTDALMETNEGLDAKLGKAFSSAGKKIGNEFLPGLKEIKKGFLELNSSTDGGLAAGILVAVQGVDMLSQGATTITQLTNGARDLKTAWDAAGTGISMVADKFKKVTDAAEDTVDTVSETADLLRDISPEDIKLAEMHGGGIAGGTNFVSGMEDDAIQDMLDYQIASADGNLSQMAVLEEKYGDMNLSANALKSESEIVDELLGDVPKSEGIVKVVDSTDEVVEATDSLKTIGPKAATNSVAAEEAAVGFSGLGAGITSMLVPLLTISAVIAIMLPVVTAIAIEAIACLKLVQMAIDAMDFGSVDLTSATEGIQQLATALGWIGVAMGAMTFANITTGLALITGGFLGIIGPIGIATDLLKQVETELQQFNNVNINESTVSNIKNITKGLKATGDAMGALTKVTISTGFSGLVAWVFQFSSITDAIKQAKTEITNAAKEISEFSSLPEIDDGAVQKLKSVSESLVNVSDAMDALRSMRDGANWDAFVGGIFNGADIQTTLKSVKEDITKASTALSGFTGLSKIPKGVSTKIKRVADTLKSVSESIETLRKLRDDSNWDSGIGGIFQGSNIIETLESIRQDMFTVSAKLRTLNDISNIPKGANKKINNVVKTLQSVMKVIDELNNVKGSNITADSSKITKSIEDARKVLYQTSSHLRSLHDISAIQEGTGDKIKRITSIAKKVMDAIKELNNIKGTQVESTNLVQSIQSARKVIYDASAELRTLSGISNIQEGTNEKIGKVSLSAKKVMTAVQSLNNIPKTVPESGAIAQAVTSVKNAATELNKLSGTALDGGVEGILGSIKSALDSLKTTLQSQNEGFYSGGANIGTSILNGLKSTLILTPEVTTAVSTATSSAASTGWTGGAYIGQSIVGGFNSSLDLHTTMTTEMGYVKTAVENGISEAKTAAQNGAAEIVQAFQAGINVGSPGDIANTIRDEMGYTYDFLKRGGLQLVNTSYDVAKNIVSSFGNPNLNVSSIFDTLNNLLSPMSAINTLSNVGSNINPAQNLSQVKQIIFNFGAGCVQVDARNKTEKEATSLMTLALESMDHVTDVQVDGE